MTMNNAAAIMLAIGLVISSMFVAFGLKSLGRSIEKAGTNSRPNIHVPSSLRLSGLRLDPLTVRFENSGGSALRIETSDGDK